MYILLNIYFINLIIYLNKKNCNEFNSDDNQLNMTTQLI